MPLCIMSLSETKKGFFISQRHAGSFAPLVLFSLFPIKMAQENKTSSNSVVILFAYDGSDFDGLERNNGDRSIEQIMFNAFATHYPSGTALTISHISRAGVTYQGEHACRQVISFSISADKLPSCDELNASLPSSIRVFKVLQWPNFSARRACEARTIEFLVPTFAFSSPPEATEYCMPADDAEIEEMPAGMMPVGGMFQTGDRRKSMKRRPVTSDSTQTRVEVKKDEDNNDDESEAKGSSGCFSCFDCFFSKKMNGSERLKEHLNHTLTRRKDKLEVEESVTSDLRRTLSRKRDLSTVLAQDIRERQKVFGNQQFSPLNIPEPTAEQLKELQEYRITKHQYDRIRFSLALFNGTHNFHNYIPGSVQEDSRCFVHINNIEAAPLEIHNNLEWLRVKVQANSFGRDMVRKMCGNYFLILGMLIMVVRTNTPRSVIANSFGIQKIDIPDAPSNFFILDEPHYNNYNVESLKLNRQPLSFSDTKSEEFKRELLNKLFEKEAKEMLFERWLRELDNYSFMYTHFLNESGVITKPMN